MVSTQAALARCSVHGGVVTPHWYSERDHPRIAEMIELHAAFVGAARRELDERLDDTLHAALLPGARLIAAVLGERFPAVLDARVSPRKAREVLFAAAASCRDPGGARTRGARRPSIMTRRISH